MCDKAVLENDETLKYFPNCHKNKKCVVDNWPHASEFVTKCYKTQEKCDKAVNTYPSTIKFATKCFVTQEMCDKAVNRCFFCIWFYS